MYKAVSRLLNPNGSTLDIDPAFDFATRITSRPYTDNVAVRKVGNVFLLTFQGAYRDLSIHDIDTRLLTTQEVHWHRRAPGAGDHRDAGPDPGRSRPSTVKAPRATTVDFAAAAVVTGQTWSVTVSLRGVSSTHSYQVTASATTPQAVLQKLAQSINNTAADVFAAGTGRQRAGDREPRWRRVQDHGLGGWHQPGRVVDRPLQPDRAAIQLSGAPAAGEVWSVTLSDVPATRACTGSRCRPTARWTASPSGWLQPSTAAHLPTTSPWRRTPCC
jgi:hypothetical protein